MKVTSVVGGDTDEHKRSRASIDEISERDEIKADRTDSCGRGGYRPCWPSHQSWVEIRREHRITQGVGLEGENRIRLRLLRCVPIRRVLRVSANYPHLKGQGRCCGLGGVCCAGVGRGIRRLGHERKR